MYSWITVFKTTSFMSTWDGAAGALVNIVLIEADNLKSNTGSDKRPYSFSSSSLIFSSASCGRSSLQRSEKRGEV